MGQTINNIVGNKTASAAYGVGVDGGVRDKGIPVSATVADNPQPEQHFFSEPASNTKVNMTMEQFEEYLRKQQEKVREAKADAATLEEQDKEAAKEIRRSLSEEEIRKLEQMGVDIEGARMSDLIGMVNTMRGNAHREETAQLFAQIKAENGDVENLSLVGGGVQISGTNVTLDSVSVSDVLVKEKAQKEEVSDVKGATDKDSFSVGDSELVYLVRNNLSLTRENMYKAHYSGSKTSKESIGDDVFQDMLSQVEKVIAQAGFAGEEKALEGAKFLISNELPVTTDSVRTYMEFQDYAGKAVESLQLPENQEEAEYQRAQKLYEDIKQLTPELVAEMEENEQVVTVASALQYASQREEGSVQEADKSSKEGKADEASKRTTKEMETDETGNQSENVQGSSKELDLTTATESYMEVVARRQVEEIRLAMTMEASSRLVKMDINIDTRELSKIVEALREMETALAKEKFANAGLEPTEQNLQIYNEINSKIDSLGMAPARILGAPLQGADFTVRGLSKEAEESAKTQPAQESGQTAQERGFETVRRSYEAVGTAPRADMGDSIAKAFSNVDDILREMELPVDYENQRAVRILGYNSMEITEENIRQVVYYDRQVNDLMDTFYPEAVLGMIKDGINPLDLPIDQLNRMIRDRNYNEGVTETDNFASYLRDMEDRGVVSKEERQSYIGIYRMVNKLAKSGDREAGWVFANGSRLTIRNLLSAMRSRKASGIDVSMDESFGLLEESISKGSRIDEQIERAFTSLGDRQNVNRVTEQDKNLQVGEASEEKIRNMERFANLDRDVEDFLTENQIAYNVTNALAADAILHEDGGIYQLVSELLAKMKFRTDEKENMVDEETENMTDSLSGEHISAELQMESILESIGREGGLSLKYEDLRDMLTELMYEGASEGVFTAMDISAIKTVNAGFNILSHMAKNDKYRIPVETEQGTKVMNLTIVHKKEAKSQIEIEIAGEQMGAVKAKISVNVKGVLTGYLISEDSNGNYALREAEKDFRASLAKSGFDGSGIHAGDMKVKPDAEVVSANAKQLYDAAVALVKAVGNILC